MNFREEFRILIQKHSLDFAEKFFVTLDPGQGIGGVNHSVATAGLR